MVEVTVEGTLGVLRAQTMIPDVPYIRYLVTLKVTENHRKDPQITSKTPKYVDFWLPGNFHQNLTSEMGKAGKSSFKKDCKGYFTQKPTPPSKSSR